LNLLTFFGTSRQLPDMDPKPERAGIVGIPLFSGQLSVSAGNFPIAEGQRVAGPMRRGLKVAVMLDGRQTLKLDDRPDVMIEGPALLVTANAGDHQQQRTGIAGSSVSCALLQFDLEFIEREFDQPVEALLASVGRLDAGLWVRDADAQMRALAVELGDASVPSGLRKLHLAGKALDLAALALHSIMGRAPLRASRLPARTRDQVKLVQERLLASMQAPPSLADLSRETGLNPTKLTAAFRAQFGMSVFAYLQEQRLQRAHVLISSGEMSVAEAAFRIGYTPAHFSGLFRKRFGRLPSSLR
jgi:AraC family transcriptional activator of pyochelin receptor